MATHSSVPAWRTQGQRSLAACSPWGRKEPDMTEHLRTPSATCALYSGRKRKEMHSTWGLSRPEKAVHVGHRENHRVRSLVSQRR